MKKILHVGEYVKGGVYTYLYDVLRYQKNSEEFDSVFLALSDSKSEKEFPICKNNIFFYKYKRNPFYIIKAMLFIKRLINQIQPDIVHVHSTFAGIIVRIPFFFCSKKNIKIVYCPHGWSFLMETSNLKKRLYGLIEKILAYRTDLILNISKHELVNSKKYGIPINRSELIYNGIEEHRNINNVGLELEIDSSKINLLFVGRFDRQKGLDILLRLFEKNYFPNIQLFLIGAAVLNENINLNLPHHVKKIGWVSPKNIDSYYNLMDAVIVPSRWEGFGLVVIEAMKNYKPVIVSNRGALPELIKEEQDGYIFDMENLSSLEQILKNLNKNKLKKMGGNARKKFELEFTSDNMNKKIIKKYKKMFSGD
ncbi:glycosyltransferase [Bacillus coagulans]|uniref:glycosyltransferase n=1 Tax=Heyndrickxia coagulans TaxID=1398 RepID=UPI0013784964|nr:glycosyltransferase [Heyndrickxia coagulans]NCG69197.1 glycosyltransferase [Heyndrickxia coagulans]